MTKDSSFFEMPIMLRDLKSVCCPVNASHSRYPNQNQLAFSIGRVLANVLLMAIAKIVFELLFLQVVSSECGQIDHACLVIFYPP